MINSNKGHPLLQLQTPDLAQSHTECGGFKPVCWCRTLTLTWDSYVTVQHKNKLKNIR